MIFGAALKQASQVLSGHITMVSQKSFGDMFSTSPTILAHIFSAVHVYADGWFDWADLHMLSCDSLAHDVLRENRQGCVIVYF